MTYMCVSTELSAGVCLLFLPSLSLSLLVLCTVPTLHSLSFTSNVSYAISPLPINAKLDACCQRSLALTECMVIICNQDNALRSLHCSLEGGDKKERKAKEKEKVCCTFTYAISSQCKNKISFVVQLSQWLKYNRLMRLQSWLWTRPIVLIGGSWMAIWAAAAAEFWNIISFTNFIWFLNEACLEQLFYVFFSKQRVS